MHSRKNLPITNTHRSIPGVIECDMDVSCCLTVFFAHSQITDSVRYSERLGKVEFDTD